MAKTKEDLEKSREIRAEVIEKFGEVPKSIWTPDYAWGKHVIELDSRKQHAVAEKKHEKMSYGKEKSWDEKIDGTSKDELGKAFSMSSQNVRGKQSGLSTFPPDLARRMVEFYSEKGDTVLDPCCVSGETLISIPEGNIPIKDLVGKNPYVYCYGDGRIRLRKALKVWKTHKHTAVLRIAIDNGDEIYVTPSHEFMLRDGTYRQARNLQADDSLMPFYRKKHKQSGRWVLNLNNGKHVKRQSIFLMEEILGRRLRTKEREECVHHKDDDKTNDAVCNLEVKDFGKHSHDHHIGVLCGPLSNATKEKLSKANSGIFNSFYGKKHTNKSKQRIGKSSIGRNVGKRHTTQTIERMVAVKKDKSYIPIILKLLKDGNLSHKKIAKLAGVHRNTVGNIARDRFNYNHKVAYIEKCTKKMDVYNMTVDEFHNYVANGIVIKNCGHNSRMQITYELERNYIGYDVCHEFMDFNRKVAAEIQGQGEQSLMFTPKNTIVLREESSEQMVEDDGSVDFIYTSPPYHDIEYYDDHPEQLGYGHTYDEFLSGIERILAECYRVLKKDKYCAWNINDFRKDGNYYMYHSDIARIMEKVGFKLHDIIIVAWKSCIGSCFASQVVDRCITAKCHEYVVTSKKT